MKRYDRDCKADEGMMFVATEKAKEWASYKNCEVGKPLEEDMKRWVPTGFVDAGIVIEVPNSDWIQCEGYVVGYYHNDIFLSCGNHMVVPDKEVAENYLRFCKQNHIYKNNNLVIKSEPYNGEKPKDMQIFNGKVVRDRSNYYGLDYHSKGDLFAEDVYWDLMNCLPPKCFTDRCSQVGEPHSHKINCKGECKPTYATFSKVAEGIWEFKGNCFYGETEERGQEIPYL